MMYPNGTRIFTYAARHLAGQAGSYGVTIPSGIGALRFNATRNAQIRRTASIPEGYAPYAWTFPIIPGAMTARPAMGISMTADLLRGGPMEASWSAGLAMNAPSLSLIVTMTATWSAAMTMNAPSLKLTSGMTAAWTAGISATAQLAMIVPLGTATWAAGMTATADLKGRLSMTAEFGGAEPLSPAGLARAVWDGEEIENGESPAEILRLMRAFMAGQASVPSGSGSFAFKSADGTKDRIAGAVDGAGNRTISSVDGT